MLICLKKGSSLHKPFILQIWTPPTPPQDREVNYVTDQCLAFLYETGTIPENHLPPTHYLK